MPELKKYNVNGHEIDFHCSARDTRHGFAHDCDLFIDGRFETSATCHYLNRTWECYRYQSVMVSAVRSAIDDRYAYLKNRYLDDNGFCKLTAKRKVDFENGLLNDERYALFKAVYDLIRER